MTRRCSRGTTLPELLTYSALMLIVLTSVYAVLCMGQASWAVGQAQVQVQQSATVAANYVTGELMEADQETVEFYPKAGFTTAAVGVVFVTARDSQGQFHYDPQTGYPQWQQYVAYYLDADPQFPGNTTVTALYRAELVAGGLPQAVASLGSTLSTPVTTDWVRLSGTNRRLISHGVSAPSAVLAHGGFDVYVNALGAKSYSIIGDPICVDMTMFTTAAKASNGPRGDSVLTSTQVHVRG